MCSPTTGLLANVIAAPLREFSNWAIAAPGSLSIEMAPVDQEAVLAAATAQKYHASLLTGDPEFKALGELLQVEWLAG